MSSNTGTQKASSGGNSKPAYRSNKSTRSQASKASGGNRSTQKRQKQQAAAEPQQAGEERNGNVSKAVKQQVNQFKAMFPQWNGATLQDVLQLFSECGNDFNAACDAVIGGYNTKQPPDSWKEVPTKAQKSKEVALKKQQRAKQQARQRSDYDNRRGRDRGDDSRGRRPEGSRPSNRSGSQQQKQQSGAPEQRSVASPTQSSSAPVAAAAPQETQKPQPVVQAFPKPTDYASAAKAGQQAWTQQQSPAEAQASAQAQPAAASSGSEQPQQQPQQQQQQQGSCASGYYLQPVAASYSTSQTYAQAGHQVSMHQSVIASMPQGLQKASPLAQHQHQYQQAAARFSPQQARREQLPQQQHPQQAKPISFTFHASRPSRVMAEKPVPKAPCSPPQQRQQQQHSAIPAAWNFELPKLRLPNETGMGSPLPKLRTLEPSAFTPLRPIVETTTA